jgi:superfamily I DNA/RNA helicase
METLLAQTFSNQAHDSRILAYTNNRVIQYNDHVRTLRQLPQEYTIGERLISNSAVHMKNRMLSVEEEVTILNQSADLVDIPMGGDAVLTVRMTTLESAYGDIFTQVPIPVDREHFRALVKYFARQKDWHTYYHLTGTYPDLRPRDAATFHKAQGSTYDSVFIDLGDLSSCRQPDQAARLLYVGFSRARTRVYLYGDLAQKYGGLIR